MKIVYRLILKLDRKNAQQIEEANKFTKKYITNKGKYGYRFGFKQLAEFATALKILKTSNIKFDYFLQIKPNSIKTLDEFSGYLIGTPAPAIVYKEKKIDSKIIEKYKIFNDLQYDKIYVTQSLKSLLDKNTRGMNWQLVRDNKDNVCYQLDSLTDLNRPLIMLKTREIKKNGLPPKTKKYTILSDGRIFIDKQSQKTLISYGWVSHNNIIANGKNYPISERFLVSSQVLKKLLAKNDYDISYIPLLDMDHHLKEFKIE